MRQTSGKLITRNYAQFRGVDFSNRKDEVNMSRSPDALNMWKNYKNENGKGIETRPDVELLAEYSNTIFGLFFYEDGVLIHSGDKIYDGMNNVLYDGVAWNPSHFFAFNNIIYFMDGYNYLQWSGGASFVPVEGFVPTTTISKQPSGGGTLYQDVNLLSPYRINSFCSDGVSNDYILDAKGLDNEQVRVWIINSEGQKEEVTSGFSTNYTDGIVTFTVPPSEPYTVGQDNVFIQYKKTVDGAAEKIKLCSLIEIFDNRVFVSGNPDYPHYVFYCERENPTYFSDTDYIEEGTQESAVKSLVAGNNALWVLKEPSNANTTVFYHNPAINDDGGKLYPSVHSSISTGCSFSGINFKDTICFYSDQGLEAITGDVTTEQALTHKSSLVDAKLLNDMINWRQEMDEYTGFVKLVEWEGYLLTCFKDKIYLADSRAYAQVNDHYEYEWFYFDLNGKIVTDIQVCNYPLGDYGDEQVGRGWLCIAAVEEDGDGWKYGMYAMWNNHKNTRELESYWTTFEDEFNYPQYQKITNKKGCVADIEGEDVEVYAKADNKTFDFIKRFKKIPKGYVVPRIKKKKWKTIQLKFRSTKPFSLYSSTLESYIGSYIKR
jgi:hypothetical protein